MATSESDGKFDPVSYQLLCQSLELHLKSFIWLADGIGHEQLRNRYGHDLVKLWREAKAKGVSRYARVTPARERTIDLLGPYYKDRKFCYLDIDMVFRGFRDLDEGPHALETLVRLTKQLGVALREPILRRANAAQ